MTFDYGDDTGAKPVGDNLMKALMDCADRQEKLEADIAKLTEELESKTSDLRQISGKEIPDLLNGITGSLLLEDGRTIEVTSKWRASIAGEKAGSACEYLDEHGHGDLVKREFVISFNKADEAWAKKFERDLKRRKKPLACKTKHTVHSRTLEAWVNEQMSNGVDLPKDIFGMHHQRTAKVKRPD